MEITQQQIIKDLGFKKKRLIAVFIMLFGIFMCCLPALIAKELTAATIIWTIVLALLFGTTCINSFGYKMIIRINKAEQFVKKGKYTIKTDEIIEKEVINETDKHYFLRFKDYYETYKGEWAEPMKNLSKYSVGDKVTLVYFDEKPFLVYPGEKSCEN